jgi:putative FmdB family regulatory protein
MPIYEFQCPNCGREYEEITGYDEVAPCPECGEAEPDRMFSRFTMASKRATLAESESSRERRESVGLPDATFHNSVLQGHIYGVYAPEGGHLAFKQSKIRAGRTAIEAGGDARIELEDTDVEQG